MRDRAMLDESVLTLSVRRFEQIPGRNAGDSSAAAYVAHAKRLRGLFSLPLKVRTKHQVRHKTQLRGT